MMVSINAFGQKNKIFFFYSLKKHFHFEVFLMKLFVFKATLYFEICLYFNHKTNAIGTSHPENQQL